MNKLSETLERETSAVFSRIVETSNQSDYASSRNALLIAAAAVVILVTIITVGTVRWISRSVDLLQASIANATQRLDLTVRVPIAGQDELAKAGEALNALLSNCSRSSRGCASMQRRLQTSSRISDSVGQLAGRSIGRTRRPLQWLPLPRNSR